MPYPMAAVRDKRMTPGAASGNGSSALYQSLVAFWKLDEASGQRNDSIGANTLTDNNTVASSTGLVYATAADFVEANSESLSIADNAALSTGDIQFWVAGWFRPDSISGSGDDVCGKWEGGQAEWFIEIYSSAGSNHFRFAVTSNGNTVTGDLDTVEAALTTGAQHMFVVWHDSVANTINAQIDGGTVRSASYSGGLLDLAAAFRIGVGVAGRYYDGLAGPLMKGKGYVPDSDDLTFLWNAGAGRTLAAMFDYAG